MDQETMEQLCRRGFLDGRMGTYTDDAGIHYASGFQPIINGGEMFVVTDDGTWQIRVTKVRDR